MEQHPRLPHPKHIQQHHVAPRVLATEPVDAGERGVEHEIRRREHCDDLAVREKLAQNVQVVAVAHFAE